MLFRSDRKSTRLNSSHTLISYAVFCLKKKKKRKTRKSAKVNHCAPARCLVLRAPHLLLCALFALLPFPLVFSTSSFYFFFFFNDTATTEIYTLSLHDALPIYSSHTLISYAVFCLRDESVTG